VNPNELMSSYMQEVEVLARKAEEAKKQLKQLTGTLTSGDGAVTVTVNAAGALQSLSFGPRADGMPKDRLAALILSTARRAQIQAAQQVTAILAPIVGENSGAMRFVQEQIPVPEEPVDPLSASEPQQLRIGDEPQQGAPRFAPPPPPPVPPRHRGRVDDDYESGPVTRQEDW
jgi:DNA-binding protein YbaB